jgi:uncharacterized protein YheU (UPF0270 family)
MAVESNHVIVPHGSLSAEALANLIDDFITREGTDYGEREYGPEEKRASVQRQLDRGTVLIVFDAESETVNLVRKEDLRELGRSRGSDEP